MVVVFLLLVLFIMVAREKVLVSLFACSSIVNIYRLCVFIIFDGLTPSVRRVFLVQFLPNFTKQPSAFLVCN